MRKKFITGAAVLALLMNSPQVSADDNVVIFGGEFDNEQSAQKKVDKPAPKKELPPKPSEEKPVPPSKSEVVKPPKNSKESEKKSPPKTSPPKELDNLPPRQPVEKPNVEPTVETDRPFTSPAEVAGKKEKVVREPVIVVPKPLLIPAEEHTTDRRPGKSKEDKTVKPPEKVNEPIIVVPNPPTVKESPIVSNSPTVKPAESPRRVYVRDIERLQPPKELKTLKPRFIKLAVDETYTYYLDKTSVHWKKMPYSSSEYIADVWIRMVERQPKEMDRNMAAYGEDNFNAEVALAHEKGYQYSPDDLQVLRSQAYVLEHYYLRPKTNQIQFLCELEVFGRPQNTVNERTYDYQNWENLVPGSVESLIYAATIKVIGKSKASERGHMTFFDMLDEYARIALN